MKEEIKHRIQRFLHDKLGWGFPLERIGGDNFQPVYICRFCNRKIVRDSTGAWFHLIQTHDKK